MEVWKIKFFDISPRLDGGDNNGTPWYFLKKKEKTLGHPSFPTEDTPSLQLTHHISLFLLPEFPRGISLMNSCFFSHRPAA